MEGVFVMTPVRMWIGLVLLALGVIGILEATGVGTGGVADWWPIAVIGLGVVAMFGRRRVIRRTVDHRRVRLRAARGPAVVGG